MRLVFFTSCALLASAGTILEELTARPGQFSQILALINKNNIVLNGTSPVTFFAPTDAAFSALNASLSTGVVAGKPNIYNNATYAAGVLAYHLLPQSFTPGPNPSKYFLETSNLPIGPGLNNFFLNFTRVVVNVNQGATPAVFTVNNANVASNITVTNGMLYVIDKVLIPPRPLGEVLFANNLNAFAAAMSMAGILGSTGNAWESQTKQTIFVPSDNAMLALASMSATPQVIAAVLNNHRSLSRYFSGDFIVSPKVSTQLQNAASNTLFVANNGVNITVGIQGGSNVANVIASDIQTDNGVIHVIDAVLIPPQTTNPTPSGASALVASIALFLALTLF